MLEGKRLQVKGQLLLPQRILDRPLLGQVSEFPFPAAALAAVIVTVLLWWLIEWRVYRRIVRLMGEPVTPFWVPLYQLFRPFYRLYCSLRDKGSKKSNFTWQHLR